MSDSEKQSSKIAALEQKVSELSEKLKKANISCGAGKDDPSHDNYHQHMVDNVIPKAKVVPGENVAGTALLVSGHISGNRELFTEDKVNLVNYSYHNPSSETGTNYTLVQLDMIYMINQIKIHLWDGDERTYNYVVEVSHDEKIWIRVCDYRHDRRTSYQVIDFQSLPVKYIKITGARLGEIGRNTNFEFVKFRCGLY